MGASSYWADLSSSPVAMGADGNLIHEFMEMERIILEQSQSIGSSAHRNGSYQPYVCRVAGIIGNMGINHECLDIASPKTLSTRSDGSNTNIWNTSYTTISGSLNANRFVHTKVMVDISNGAGALSSNVVDIFGYNTTKCGVDQSSEGKIMGDGVINSFDLYVIASAQFRQGPYAQFADQEFSQIATTRGRPDTKDRCCQYNTQDCPEFDRLEWQLRYAFNPCYSYTHHEEAYAEAEGRRLLQETLEPNNYDISTAAAAASHLSAHVALFEHNNRRPIVEESSELLWAAAHPQDHTKIGSQKSLVGWSPYGLYNTFNATHASSVQTTMETSTYNAQNSEGRDNSEMEDLGANIFEYSVTAQGTWYWINIPSVHLSLELTLSSLGFHDPIPVSNERPPEYMENRIPYNPMKYNLRYTRHREFYEMDTSDCAVIQSSRLSSNSMENGVIHIGQSLVAGKSLCGFDLMLWKPSGAYSPADADDPVCIVSGSMSMSGTGGSMQYTTQCAVSMATISPPPPPPASQPFLLSPPQAPVTTNTTYSVSFIVYIDGFGFGEQNQTAYENGLLEMLQEGFESNLINVQVTVQESENSTHITATATCGDFDSANNTLSLFTHLTLNELVNLMSLSSIAQVTSVTTGEIVATGGTVTTAGTVELENSPPTSKQKNNRWLETVLWTSGAGILFVFACIMSMYFFAQNTKDDEKPSFVPIKAHSAESMPLMTMNPLSIVPSGRR